MKKLYRIKKDSKLGGVCTGLSEYFDIDPVIIRVFFIIAIPFGGIGIWSYLIMWLVVPEKASEGKDAKNSPKKLYLSYTNKKIGGVCGGLGEFLDLDPTILRIIFMVLLLIGGLGLLLYIILWLVVPKQKPKSLK